MKRYILSLTLAASVALAKDVSESARTIPLAYDVDVVVVGGSSGGVAAAVEAAKAGAKVFLAAPRAYLGEDICGTYRLWLEPGEKPATELAKEVFKLTAPIVHPGIHFTYTADKPSTGRHQDTKRPSLLTDGKWSNATKESVQFDSDVTLVLDLGKDQDVRKVNLLSFQRPKDFLVDTITISTSPNKKVWTEIAKIQNQQREQPFEESALPLAAEVSVKTRYLKLAVTRPAGIKRLLLAEAIVETEATIAASKPAAGQSYMVTPMQVKRTLDDACIKHGVQFLYGSYATELLKDAEGKPAGVVISNRSGRQAVRAKVIIDATERATIARLAKASFSPYPSGTHTFTRIVVGGEACKNESVTSRPCPVALIRGTNAFPVIEYKVQLQMKDDSFAAFAAAEQQARDWTWTKQSVDSAETLFEIPPDSFRSRGAQIGPWVNADHISLDALQPAGVERMFVLGGCADISREAAASLLRPVNIMAAGKRVGQAAAALAKTVPNISTTSVAGELAKAPVAGQLGEVSSAVNPRLGGTPAVGSDTRSLPVLGEYDVVVVGGGTGGAPAAVSAGRQGAKTLLIEYLYGLGGVGTIGLIGKYYFGYLDGFTAEIDKGVAAFGPFEPKAKPGSWNVDWKSEWFRKELRKSGVDLWYGAMGTGALVENGRVRGVVVVTPMGRGVVTARMVIDATGNSDIAAAAGAKCLYTDDSELAVQGTGLPPRELKASYTNTDYTFVDETDVVDIWRALVQGRQKFKNAYDLGQLVDTRERRQIVGDFTISPLDEWIGRTYPDTVVLARSNYDTHGYTIHPMFFLRPPHKQALYVRVPYRSLLPQNLDGILVIGLGVSAHRDAVPLIRMQPDVQNMGYAAGVAAAMIAKAGCTARDIDLKALQKHLIEKRCLPESVLTETDSLPMPKERVAEAVNQAAKDFQGLEVVLAHEQTALPLLRAAFTASSEAKTKLVYANILGMLGDKTGSELLAEAVSKTPWDQGWHYKSGGQFGACLSRMDSLVLALGRSRDPRALEPILAKAATLDASSEFSHFRAVAVALESLGNPAACKPLAELLKKPEISGNAFADIKVALQPKALGGGDTTGRNAALRELSLARVLYRLGDHEGLGEKILRDYAQDLHGHYARHAQALLKQKPGMALVK